jgi:hypothetical protein
MGNELPAAEAVLSESPVNLMAPTAEPIATAFLASLISARIFRVRLARMARPGHG